MGDYPLAKNQKDLDCIYFLLQVTLFKRKIVFKEK